MTIRSYIDLVHRLLREAKATDVTGAFIERAIIALDAEQDLADVGISFNDKEISGFSADLPNMVEVNDLDVPEDRWREGLGTRVMEIVCAISDEMGITLVLRTWDSPDLDLDAWYARFGFRGSRTMWRSPKGSGV